jgi:flagellar P-ring protein precursor FlgI
LVTAEVSPYLRPGGRFEVQVASVGNARSLKGGVLWMTPLQADVGGKPVATAQGTLLVGDLGATRRMSYTVETSGRMPDGGLLEMELPRPQFADVSKLLLRSPDIGVASRIAAAIDTALGAGTAKVEDPGAIELTLKDGDKSTQLSKIKDLTVTVAVTAKIVIDSRDGTVVTGGEVPVGPGMVNVGSVTLSIGTAPADTLAGRGNVHLAPGASVQQLASALHRVQMPPSQIAMVFEALRRAGAISAEVVTR